MEWDTLLGPVGTGIQEIITDVTPIGITVFLALAGIGIALKVFGKFGVRK